MGIMSIQHAIDATSSMRALRRELAEDLDHVESRIHELTTSLHADSRSTVEELEIYFKARAALYSGLASVTDVLGWVHLMAEKDAYGNDIDPVRSLPTVPVSSIN